MGNSVAIILVDNEGKFLFHLRDNNNSIPYPDYWSLISGHIEKDEIPTEAIKREVLEEIEHEIDDPIFIGDFNDGNRSKVYVFKSEINKKIDEITLHEGQRLDYFSFEDVLKIKTQMFLGNFL